MNRKFLQNSLRNILTILNRKLSVVYFAPHFIQKYVCSKTDSEYGHSFSTRVERFLQNTVHVGILEERKLLQIVQIPMKG